MNDYQSPDMKRRTSDVERIGTGTFITGFAWGVLTLAFLLACFDFAAR